MVNIKKLKIGDVIIRFGQVHKVFKTKGDGDKKLIFYKRFFPNLRTASSIFSIPQKNIEKSRIRVPLSKKELKILLGEQLKNFAVTESININTAKTSLNSDDPENILQTLKALCWEKTTTGKLPFSKKEIYESLLSKISGEVAFVENIDKERAREKIETALAQSLTLP